MKERSINDRLNEIEDIIVNNPFSDNNSLSSGTGGYIFDYDPKDELTVREFVKVFKNKKGLGFEIQEFDLFEMMINHLKSEGDLDATFEIEEECRTSDEGIDFMISAMSSVQSDSQNDIFVERIRNEAKSGNVIFITGVGKCHPFIRSHRILNNFDSKMNGVKTVLFYPGEYRSDSLKLFGTISSENYYRSMILVERYE